MSVAFDPWVLEETGSAKDIRSSSLVDRARKRTVYQVENGWRVKGEEKFGDSLPSYMVKTVAGENVYYCSCYESRYGETRAKRMCSHVMAVVLGRRGQIEVRELPRRKEVANVPLEQQASAGGAVRREPTETWSDVSGGVVPPAAVHVGQGNIPDPRDPLFGFPQLPPWVEEFRPVQWEAIQEIRERYQNGSKVVFLDAPTGSGKTLIGETVRRLVGGRGLYTCSGKSLQDQFFRDFDYAKVLKGRANYPTQTKPFPDFTAADCTKNPADGEDAECMWCWEVRDCAYEVAKRGALSSALAVLNTSYLLAEANYIGGFSGRPLVILDECDVLEEELMRFVEFGVSERMLRNLGLDAPKKGAHKGTIARWMLEELMPGLQEKTKGARVFSDPREIRQQNAYVNLLRDVRRVAEEVLDENWIRDNGAGPLTMKPIKVDGYGERLLWRHGAKWLLMSATIVSAEEVVESLGYKGEWAVVRVPMQFPVENRRINVAPVADMANKNKEESWPKVAEALRSILNVHRERILVHTVSYELARYLEDRIADPRIVSYRNSGDREAALTKYRNAEGAVLLAPSFDRGVDLKGDDCRVQVIAKVPFPNLGDPVISARLRSPGGQAWYNVQTVRTLVQMTGRAIRNQEDWAVTYILDRQFAKNVMNRSRRLLPEWWKEALDTRYQWKWML